MKKLMPYAPIFIIGGAVGLWFAGGRGFLGSTVATKIQSVNKKIGVSS